MSTESLYDYNEHCGIHCSSIDLLSSWVHLKSPALRQKRVLLSKKKSFFTGIFSSGWHKEKFLGKIDGNFTAFHRRRNKIFNILLNIKSMPMNDLIRLLSFLSMFTGNLVITIVIASQSERCSRQLASSVAFMISSHQMSEMERQSALAFLYNIQANTMTARPCDLYDINYSLMLQMLNVVVTYSVIILQFDYLCTGLLWFCKPAF